MPNSLRCMFKKLRHEGKISNEEYEELVTKLDNHDRVIINNKIDEIYDVKKEVDGIKDQIDSLRAEIYELDKKLSYAQNIKPLLIV